LFSAILVESRELRVERKGWRLQIAGTGSEESLQYLKKLCKENGVEDSVDFLGFVSNMESLYKKASVFVLSSRYEGFGLVLIEAMSQGCACVACDYKGRQREIVYPKGQGSKFNFQGSNNKFEACENGILCEPDNVEALAAGIQKMITDDEYRENVRANAIERSKYYSIENTMERWKLLLNQVVKV
jgi:glycosyltransferase involved in cell wall biosynthesis